jgi:hypothetical protein
MALGETYFASEKRNKEDQHHFHLHKRQLSRCWCLRAIGCCCGRAGATIMKAGVKRASSSRCGVMVRQESSLRSESKRTDQGKKPLVHLLQSNTRETFSRSRFGDFVGSDLTDSARKKVLSGVTELQIGRPVFVALMGWDGAPISKFYCTARVGLALSALRHSIGDSTEVNIRFGAPPPSLRRRLGDERWVVIPVETEFFWWTIPSPLRLQQDR